MLDRPVLGPRCHSFNQKCEALGRCLVSLSLSMALVLGLYFFTLLLAILVELNIYFLNLRDDTCVHQKQVS